MIGDFKSGLTTMSEPVTDAELDGAKTTLKLMFFPGAKVRGTFKLERVNPVPETCSRRRSRESAEVLVILTV